MLASVSELVSWLAGRFRSRAKLELEVIALRHQLAVLHRQRPGRPQLFALDRLCEISRNLLTVENVGLEHSNGARDRQYDDTQRNGNLHHSE
jgi:hypothetical protein